jgi:pyruvate kinase
MTVPPTYCEIESLSQLHADISQLYTLIRHEADEYLSQYLPYYSNNTASVSAINLAHYIVLRRRDLRGLQQRLSVVGLSSLGRSESHVLDNIERILKLLDAIMAHETQGYCVHANTLHAARQLLDEHADRIFGKRETVRAVRIMVTLPTEAAYDLNMLRELLQNGMDCARINCAHDDTATWESMAANLHQACEQTGRSCRLIMDLAGHKLRTGPIPEAAVKHIKTFQDALGHVTAPAELLLCTGERSHLAMKPGNHVAIPAVIHNELASGDQLTFTDTRGRIRALEVFSRNEEGDWRVHCQHHIWLPQRAEFTWHRLSEHGKREQRNNFCAAPFRGEPLPIRLKQGDQLLLRPDQEPGSTAIVDHEGSTVVPAAIGITLPHVLDVLHVGAEVWLDDGKIGGCIEEIRAEGLLLRITEAGPNGARLQADKGVNFPGVKLPLPTLSNKDLHDLDFVCRHADMVGFSFVESLADMEELIRQLNMRGAAELPIVAKIETDRAVRNLPEILLGTIGRRDLAVMIARGDLAVELGNSRLAEIQEELLWMCEAAHVPVIWATQVLENLVKKGIRSRPEFTDAAMSGRAECVMLNKGPYILQGVQALSNVLTRMEGHQQKKAPRLRALHW